METKDIYGPGNDNYGRDKWEDASLQEAIRSIDWSKVKDTEGYSKQKPVKPVQKVKPSEPERILDIFIKEIKDEFNDQNWDYLDFIKERVLRLKSLEPERTVEEILSKHSKNYGECIGNPRVIVKASEAIEAMKEYASQLPKSELPSDEEIENAAWYKLSTVKNTPEVQGFIKGAKWMRNKLKR